MYDNKNKRINQKRKSKKKAILVTFYIFLIIIVSMVTSGYFYVVNKLNKMQQVEISEEELMINEEVKQKLQNYRNVAIFCVDSREDDLGKGNRSDGIIIASLDNKTNDVNLISVYRDTYLDIEGYGLDKVTHAYSYGSAPLAIATLNRNLDLNIKEFVTINFDILVEAVNLLGGVEINVEQEEIKYLNMYSNTTNVTTSNNTKSITRPGLQTLDGMQALSYSRIRYTAGGDYKRTERMRDVMTAILEKAKKSDVFTINKLLDNVLPDIYTNISSSEILGLVPSLANYEINTSMGWPYETKGITLNAWYGVPVTLETNVQKLHKDMFGADDYEMSTTVKNINTKIKNKTGYTK